MIARIFRWLIIAMYSSVVLFSIPVGVYFYAAGVGDPPLQSAIYATAFYWGIILLGAISISLWKCFGSD